MRLEIDSERVGRYREAISDAWGHNGDANVWPIKLNAAIHLFLEDFADEFLDDLTWLESKGWSAAEIARPFYNPSRMFRIIDSVVYGLRRRHRPLAEQRAIVTKLLTMAKALKYGSEFNDDGRNVIYDPEETASVTATLLNEPVASLADSQRLHRLCGMLWAYTEAVFFRAHDVPKEIHGPYPCANGSQFIVKEYLNLRPVDIWPDMPLLPCHTIKVYQQYNSAVRIRIDALNHIYHEGTALVPNLESFAVVVDDEVRNLQAVELLGAAGETVAAISHYIDTLSWHERVIKYAEIFWFRKKPLCDLRGRDWRLSDRVRERIRRGAEHDRRRVPLSGEASARLGMLTI